MAQERRVLRLQSSILELAAETLQREVEDPRLAMVSFTRVKLTTDLALGTLYWSCLITDKGRPAVEEALQGVLPLIQARVFQGLGIRTTPTLSLRFDPTLERAQRLESIFHKLSEERGPSDGDPAEGGTEDGVPAEEPPLDAPPKNGAPEENDERAEPRS